MGVSNDDIRLPLTSSQSGMWFAQQLDPENPAFKGVEYVDIRGRVDVGLLEVAVGRALAEMEALLVRVEVDDAGVWQVIDRDAERPIQVLDLRGEVEPWARALAWMRAEMRAPVDLSRAGSATLAVLRITTDRTVLYISVHHLMLDGFGFSLFIRRVSDIYTALDAGAECPANEWATLADLVGDEASYRASDRFTTDRGYWATHLANRPPAVSLAGRLTRASETFLRETSTIDAAAVTRPSMAQ